MTDEIPRREQVYQHYKGKSMLYEIVDLARNADNPEKMFVIYRSLYEGARYPKGTIWSRSLDDFMGFATQDGIKVKRFTLLPRV